MNLNGKTKCINHADCGGYCYPPFKICLLCHRFKKAGMDIKTGFDISQGIKATGVIADGQTA